ncbi:1681_t:CDS:2, partial [Gigaspora rosea]
LNKVLTILTSDAHVTTIITDRELALNKLKKEVEVDKFISDIQKLIYKAWMPYKESWLVPYMNNNINLDIRSTQRVGSLHSKLKGVENCIIPVDKLLSIIWRQLQEHSQKFLMRCSCIKTPQQDLAMISVYEITYENRIYNVIQID